MGIHIYSRRDFLKAIGLGIAAFATRSLGLARPPLAIEEPRLFTGPIQGVVFTDLNKTGVKGPNEPVRAGVAVSDGLDIVLTGPDGRYRLPNTTGQAEFVYVVQPNDSYKSTTSFYRLPRQTGSETKEINFGLLPLEKNAQRSQARFVQLTDIHTTDPARRDSQIEAYLEVLNLTPPPDFVIATGDLVNKGSQLSQFDNYLPAVNLSAIPYFNVIGNHDLDKSPSGAVNYRGFFGPDYFSFDHGGIHFVVLNSITASDRQQRWLLNDLALLGTNKPVVAFQHYPPGASELKKFDDLNVHSIFTGHWHSEKIVKSAKTIGINSPTFLMGGIDGSGAGFRVVDIDADGNMKTHWRYGGVKQKAIIVAPAANSTVHQNSPILANIYDSSLNVQKVRWQLYQKDKLKAEGTLSQDSVFSWSGTLPQTGEPGPATLRITAEVSADKKWQDKCDFNFGKDVPAAPKPVGSWPMFMGGAVHTGSSDTNISVPLSLAWSSSTGGELDFSSPIFAEGKLYVAVRSRRSDGENGVVALEPSSGRILWKFISSQAINHSPAYESGVICIAEVGGRVHGLSAVNGKQIWSHDLGDNLGRWIYGAPAGDNGRFYIGTMNRFARINARTGEVEWEKRIADREFPGWGQPPDWISSRCSPAISKKYLVMGGFWTGGDNIVVFDKNAGIKLWGNSAEKGVQTSPTIADGKVLFSSKTSNLYCHNLVDGKLLWSAKLSQSWSLVTAAVKGQTIVAGSGDGIIKSLRLSDGKEIWSFRSGPAIFKVSPYRRDNKGAFSSPIIAVDKVFFGSDDGHLYCLDLKTGKELWSYNFGVPVLSTPLVSGNSLFVTAYDGRVYAFTCKNKKN